MTDREATVSAPRRPAEARVVAPVFIAIGVGLAVWTAYLAFALPPNHLARNWDIAWAGFDTALVVLMFLVAYGVLTARWWLQGVASAAAALVLTDAWFDVLTASPGHDRFESLLLSLTSELPLALLCGWIAFRAGRTAHGGGA